ncbi:MAG: WYL domain-containing protein [Proteobacteria bacterium]|nr:WYL domain-containing protein [Pseudomonadota bacterium]MBU1715026.1 WYL domain-containing protein [Pseudomonadota bacterium]
MRWNIEKRIEFIETRLFWEGKISRKDLTEFFGISIPQATKDLKEYCNIAPKNIYYDRSAKLYVATENFTPNKYPPSSEKYLTRLRLSQERKDSDKFFNGPAPSFYEMPKFRRLVKEEILRDLLKAIQKNEAIKIHYQSMSSPEPKMRWITPHSLGHDGFRWHTRAFCHNRKCYVDFNLGRISAIIESAKHNIDHAIDYEWHNEITITIAPNPKLEEGPQSCIERDYCMEGGQATINIKAALFYYFIQNFGLKKGHEKRAGNDQQVVLVNFKEIEPKIKLLKSMSKDRISELIKQGNIDIYIN